MEGLGVGTVQKGEVKTVTPTIPSDCIISLIATAFEVVQETTKLYYSLALIFASCLSLKSVLA